ncbi:glutathione S-transferase family protein [Pseudoalteromonas maricaloris]|uniref:glutathione S-transferase family protein n=1 Tax=Pseudoalteromonas maricaloris TaxID=184924 RepID=UPI00057C8907|nr:glutathione S-transferase family protein [Pseudoalteromonas flavipulchra]KID35352.1 glutathione S-transferase [Pseudoalteromonas flavipulchra NCIMB 2033 = ATCC BAA-314]MBD0780608.1 glutathione S-transferase family protein [Pseudoalteromonas flavipulchra]MBE0375399.1 glutathione S-transferase [Pseudoalteromonas flavipulchra NCIMB 2033 = ATCC BAA-314]
MYTLFYYPQSASLAPHILLELIGEPYQLELVDIKKNANRSTQYLTLSPAGQVPALVDDDFTLFESAAISQYLAEKHIDKQLIPTELKLKSQCLQWMHFMSASIHSDLLMYTYPERHTQSALMYDDLIRSQQGRLEEGFGIIDTLLADNHYLFANQFTLCDSYLFMLCERAKTFLEKTPSLKNLRRYYRQISATPAISKALEMAEF